MLSINQIQEANKPLRLILWGSLIWILDLSVSSVSNGSGFRFDILDDTVGSAMIAVAVFRLARIPVSKHYGSVMGALRWVAVLSVGDTAIKHFIFPQPDLLTWLQTALSLSQFVGATLFCLAMTWFCEAAGFYEAGMSWTLTFRLFAVLYGLPVAILCLVALGRGESQHYNLMDMTPVALLLIPVLLSPIIHFYVSLSRTRRVVKSGLPLLGPKGFPVVSIREPKPPHDLISEQDFG